MVVTSCSTDAGTGVTGVKSLADVLLPPAIFTITNTATTTMTSPTAPQAIIAPDSLRGGEAGAGLPPGRGGFPPLPRPPLALATFPAGALPVTGRLWARLRSLAL